MAKGKPLSSVQTSVRHLIRNNSLCIDHFHAGILVRDEAAKGKLQQRVKSSIIMLGLRSRISCLPDPFPQDLV